MEINNRFEAWIISHPDKKALEILKFYQTTQMQNTSAVKMYTQCITN
jgi:hypothetical protein